MIVTAPPELHPLLSPAVLLPPDGRTPRELPLLEAVLEGLMDGILLLTMQGELLHANRYAYQLCQHLHRDPGDRSPDSSSSADGHPAPTSTTVPIPSQIWHLCQALIESHTLFPEQWLVLEDEVVCDALSLRVRVQWLYPDADRTQERLVSPSLLLVRLEDRLQSLKWQAIADQKKYDLTPRETEVWLLRLQGHSYQQIASTLYITEHTVRKHSRSILAKRRALLESNALTPADSHRTDDGF